MNKLLLFYAYVNSWLSGPSAFRYAVRSRKKSFFPLTVKNSINIYCEGTYIHTHFAPGAIIKRRQLHNRSLWNLPTVTPLLLAKILVISLTKRNLKRGSQVGDSPLASTYTDSWAGTVGYRRPDTGQGAVVKTLLAHAHRGGAFLHRFLGILHLEEVSIWGEDSDCPVIPRRHLQRFSLCGGLPTAEAQCPVTPAATCYPEVLDWGAWRSRPEVPEALFHTACWRHQALGSSPDSRPAHLPEQDCFCRLAELLHCSYCLTHVFQFFH